jgi:hypothetical protein
MEILTTTSDPRYRELTLTHVPRLCRDARQRLDRSQRRLHLVYRDLEGREGTRDLRGEVAEDLIVQIVNPSFREAVREAYETHDPYRQAAVLLWLIDGGLGLIVVRYDDLMADEDAAPEACFALN